MGIFLLCIPYIRLVIEPLDTQAQASKKRDDHLSSDGQWRSFPKAPNLLPYVSNGNYYGRIKIGGKVIRRACKRPFGHRRNCDWLS
jgi:hypothetical protein